MLAISCHATVIDPMEHFLHGDHLLGRNRAAEKDMKIYLLIVLISTLLIAIRFTSVSRA